MTTENTLDQFEVAYATFPRDRVRNAEALMAIPEVKRLCKLFYGNGAARSEAAPKKDGLDDTLGKIDKAVSLLRALKEMSDDAGMYASAQPMGSDAEIEAALDSLPVGHALEQAHVLDAKTGKVHSLDVRGKSRAEIKAQITKFMETNS